MSWQKSILPLAAAMLLASCNSGSSLLEQRGDPWVVIIG